MFGRVGRWLEDRLGLTPLLRLIRTHRVPRALEGRAGWMYVFGLSTLLVLASQVVTGLALTTVYIPSPEAAYDSLVHLTRETSWGSLVRAMHFYGASAMVVLMLCHMARVYLTASYKYPREMGWISGVVLFGLVMAMALTGQLLRWDQNGVWTVIVASKFLVRVPFVGEWLAKFTLGGPTLTGVTLSRFFALHAIFLPLVILAFVGLHLYLLIANGISEPPKTGESVDPATYRAKYARLKDEGTLYWPFHAWRELLVAFVALSSIFVLALTLGPRGPFGPPNPTNVTADPRPDWFVRWWYALLWLKPESLEGFVMIGLPIVMFVGMVLLPIVFRSGERSVVRRPWAPVIVVGLGLFFGGLTVLGIRPPWSPAYETEPFRRDDLGPVEAQVARGAHLFFEKGCQYCHLVLDRGGAWGPELTFVARRMSIENVAVWIVGGGGDMPPYRNALDARELDALLAFLNEAPQIAGRREAR